MSEKRKNGSGNVRAGTPSYSGGDSRSGGGSKGATSCNHKLVLLDTNWRSPQHGNMPPSQKDEQHTQKHKACPVCPPHPEIINETVSIPVWVQRRSMDTIAGGVELGRHIEETVGTDKYKLYVLDPPSHIHRPAFSKPSSLPRAPLSVPSEPTRSVPSRLPTLVSATEERLEEDTKAEVAECSLRGLNCHQIAAKLQIAPRAVWKACYEMVVDGILPDMPAPTEP